jgi:hypothetical protein
VGIDVRILIADFPLAVIDPADDIRVGNLDSGFITELALYRALNIGDALCITFNGH